jgi:hypothetical protein
VTCPRRGAAAACCLAAALAAPAAACEAVLREHRSGTELARVPLEAAQPELRIAFEHSVLGTTVVDRYRFTPRPRLVEERFDGQGYGLPHAAGPGETLQRDGTGWRLVLDRAVDPLVVRPLPAQRMRIVLADRELPLATLSSAAIEIAAHGCPARPAP